MYALPLIMEVSKRKLENNEVTGRCNTWLRVTLYQFSGSRGSNLQSAASESKNGRNLFTFNQDDLLAFSRAGGGSEERGEVSGIKRHK